MGLISLAGQVQRKLQWLYALDELPPVEDFASPCGEDEREQVLLREQEGEVELAVRLPPEGLCPGARGLSFDAVCQVIEGVSHFVYLAWRIGQDLPTTHLELELQAEVDKFALLALDPFLRAEQRIVQSIHARLYEQVSYLHGAETEEGRRYRLASRLAARFWAKLGARKAAREATVTRLRAFHRGGQAEKIRLALAA
ncbi:MAG: hypothetical protein RMJ98_19270 [Myxococcales bacterium]|nr:hypothetical protein [Polyangiaceae bacterium]MDW8251441.1 hypothetical protein [Myxococcales bacterium]